MNIVIYHNPRCGKSRQTLQLLQEQGVQPTVVEYLKSPPSVAELKNIIALLGIAPRELMRIKEDAYKAQRLDNPSLTDAQLIVAMHENPILIERPIVVIEGAKAAIGRPPERVLELFRK